MYRKCVSCCCWRICSCMSTMLYWPVLQVPLYFGTDQEKKVASPRRRTHPSSRWCCSVNVEVAASPHSYPFSVTWKQSAAASMLTERHHCLEGGSFDGETSLFLDLYRSIGNVYFGCRWTAGACAVMLLRRLTLTSEHNAQASIFYSYCIWWTMQPSHCPLVHLSTLFVVLNKHLQGWLCTFERDLSRSC